MTAKRKVRDGREIDLADLFYEITDAAFELSELFNRYAVGWVVFHGGRQAELIRAHLDPDDGLIFEVAYMVDGMLSATQRVSYFDLEFVTAESVVVDWEGDAEGT